MKLHVHHFNIPPNVSVAHADCLGVALALNVQTKEPYFVLSFRNDQAENALVALDEQDADFLMNAIAEVQRERQRRRDQVN
jgi:hypothetical protein